MLIFEE